MKIEIIRLFPIDEEGRLKPHVEVAVYLDSAEERAVYSGSIEGPITFDRIETRYDPNAAEHADREWAGRRSFGVRSYGEKTRKAVREWTAEILAEARARGALLELALDVAVTQRDLAQDWANARARHLANLPEEHHKRRYGGLLAAMSSVEGETQPSYEQFQRILTLNANISSLGGEFQSRRSDDHYRAARFVGIPAGKPYAEAVKS